jgi:hypothetical protein
MFVFLSWGAELWLYRPMFLVLGMILFIIAPKVGAWLPSYFGSAMTLSLIFVVLILLDQVLSSSQVLIPSFHYNWILLISELYQDIVLSVCEIALETGSGIWTNPNKDILFDLWVFQCLKLLPTGHKSTIYIALLSPVVRDLISPKYNLIFSRVLTQQNPKHTEKAPPFFFLVLWNGE